MQSTSASDEGVCHAYLEAFKARDFSRMESLLTPQFRFRALVPGFNDTGELRTSETAAGTVKYMKAWFGDCDQVEILSSEVYRVGSRYHISYRGRMHDADGWQVFEQRNFCDVKHGRIEGMDLLCSGPMKEQLSAGDSPPER